MGFLTRLNRSANLSYDMAAQVAKFPGDRDGRLILEEAVATRGRVLRCYGCAHQDECETLLAAGDLGAAPEFCRNKDEIEALALR